MAILPYNKAYVRTFKMVSNATLKAGLTVTLAMARTGGAFVTPSGAVAEMSNGWYKVSCTAGDLNALGDLSWYATASGADDTDWVDQVGFDVTNSANLGLHSLSNRPVASSGGFPIVGAVSNGLNLDNSGRVDVGQILTVVINSMISGRIDANAQVVGDKTGYSLSQTFPSNFSALSIDAAGRIDVGKFSGFAVDTGATNRPTVNVDFIRSSSVNTLISGRVDANAQVVGDKTGYSLTQSFPANFSSLSINAAGRVDVGNYQGVVASTDSTTLRPDVNVTFVRGSSINALISGRIDANSQVVGDKTGYSLTQAFPANFSSLSIDGNGRVFSAGSTAVLKNSAISNFPFMMISTGDHVTGVTGATVLAQRSIDGASFANCANAAVEVGSGWYKINLATTDLNGATIALKFTAPGADVTNIGIATNV